MFDWLTNGWKTNKVLARLEISLARLERKLEFMASKVQEWAAVHEASLVEIATELNAISSGVINLDKLIAVLQNSPGAITPGDQVILDRIQAASKSLVSTAQAIKVDAADVPKPPTA